MCNPPGKPGSAPSRARCPVLQRPGPLSPWFSPALVAKKECAEPRNVGLALGSVLNGCWGLSPQVIKEASSPAAGGMEAPTSPVMPCKMDLDKVMVSNRPDEVLHGAAAAKPGEWGAGGALSSQCCAGSLPILPAGLQGLWASPGTRRCPSPRREGRRADSGHRWGLHRVTLLTGCLLCSPHSGCHRRSTPRTQTVWQRVRPAPQQPAESLASMVRPLPPARRVVRCRGGQLCAPQLGSILSRQGGML